MPVLNKEHLNTGDCGYTGSHLLVLYIHLLCWKGESMESKEDFIREVRELLNANEKVVHVELNQIVDMVHELAESYRY